MLRVTPETTGDGVERFKLEGRLAGAYVTELGRVLQPSLTTPGDVVLDLRGLTFVDADGAELLRTLASRNVEIHGCSGFVAHLLALPTRRSGAQAAWDEVVEMLAARHAASAVAGGRDEAALLERLRPLLGTARRLLGRENDARQVVEETLKAALRTLRIRGQSPSPIELHRAMIDRALKSLRREAEEVAPFVETLLPRFDLAGHHAAPIAAWVLPEPAHGLPGHLADRVLSVLSGMPAPYRALFLLSDVEGLAPEQVAIILPLTPAQVKAQRHTARQMLREGLTPIFGAAPQARPDVRSLTSSPRDRSC